MTGSKVPDGCGMSDDANLGNQRQRADEATNLKARMRDGKPVFSVNVDVEARYRSLEESTHTLERRAGRAPADKRGEYGYLAHKARSSLGNLAELAEARYEGWHKSMWLESDEGITWTVCSCGVMVQGRVGYDFSEEDFRAAQGHVSMDLIADDATTCPRCRHGLPNDESPGSRTGFQSLTIQVRFVCDACREHQMWLGYRPYRLGDEKWPVQVPQRFYDLLEWPRRRSEDLNQGE